jgi:hypothetical protein
MWSMVKKGCRANPASIAAASGKLDGAGEGASRARVRRITIATPISISRSVIAQRIRTNAGRGFIPRAHPSRRATNGSTRLAQRAGK